jgi:hypothetical protein
MLLISCGLEKIKYFSSYAIILSPTKIKKKIFNRIINIFVIKTYTIPGSS